jgi:GDP-4-dehydro-6-deoxy-D-mannose reductase
VAASERERDLTFRVNFLGSQAVLEGVSRVAPAARLLWVGSGEIYGVGAPDAAPFDEGSALRPRSPYARSKACADLLAAGYAGRGLDVVRARPFNHTGPGQSEQFVLPSFARQLAGIASGHDEPVLRVGNLDSVRDFLDVEDVVQAYASLLDPRVPAGAYNVASGEGRRIGDLLDALIERAGVDVEVRIEPEYHRPTDRGVGDATRLRRATDWSPRVPFATTLDRVFSDAARRPPGT